MIHHNSVVCYAYKGGWVGAGGGGGGGGQKKKELVILHT